MERKSSRLDIECPQDTITYSCSISSNTETPHLIWKITFPEQNPITIKYQGNSSVGRRNSLAKNITVSLTSYESVVVRNYRQEYMESVIILTILKNINMNGTSIECSVGDLGMDSEIVHVNTSGIMN